MSSIAYITDSKLLDMHRLNSNKEMNFWRLSCNTSFSDFRVGDLVFFLSKDKNFLSGEKEKGIVGLGRLSKIIVDSPIKMWKRYGKLNGYNTFNEFEEAILKVSKKKELPNTISSFYLDNVTFLGSQLYLSEYGINVSKNVESYIYIEDTKAIKILENFIEHVDFWSSAENVKESIHNLEMAIALGIINKQIKDIELTGSMLKKAIRETNKYIKSNPLFNIIKGSLVNGYMLYENNLNILLYNSKDIDIKEIVGEATLYKKLIRKYYPHPLNVSFVTTDDNKEIKELLLD